MPNNGQLLFEELRTRFSEHLTASNVLDGKANNLITISGTIGTLLFGFGTFSIENMDLGFIKTIFFLSVLITGISLIILSIILSVKGLKVQEFRYPSGYQVFYKENRYSKHINNKEELNMKVVDQFFEVDEKTFYRHFITEYIQSIKRVQEINREKAKKIRYSEICFSIGIIISAIAFGILFITYIFNSYS